MTEIVFSPEAISDLKMIKEYITEEFGSETTAKNTVAKIFQSIEILHAFPESGAPLSSIVSFDTEYRFIACGKYTIFYRHKNEKAFIIRIIYSRRDFMRILFKEQENNK